MGVGTYKQLLLLLTNASEDVITKLKAKELFLHHKTYTQCVKISETVGNLYTADTAKQQTLGVRPKLSVIWRFHCTYIFNRGGGDVS